MMIDINAADQERAEIVRSILQAALPECEIETWRNQPHGAQRYAQFKAQYRVGNQVYGSVMDMQMETLRNDIESRSLAGETAAQWASWVDKIAGEDNDDTILA